MASKPQKTVLIGITGCIAAYKAAEIVRGLQKADVRVKVITRKIPFIISLFLKRLISFSLLLARRT